jgi:exodeoxyribonuclease VII small subunit
MPDERVDLKSFERSYEELESLVRKLEGGELTLDESLAHYEHGVAALKRCYRILEQAEKRLELLVREGDGSLATRPADLAHLRGEARGEAKIGAPVAACESPRERVDVTTGEVLVAGAAPPPAPEAARPAPVAAAAAAGGPRKKESGERSLF